MQPQGWIKGDPTIFASSLLTVALCLFTDYEPGTNVMLFHDTGTSVPAVTNFVWLDEYTNLVQAGDTVGLRAMDEKGQIVQIPNSQEALVIRSHRAIFSSAPVVFTTTPGEGRQVLRSLRRCDLPGRHPRGRRQAGGRENQADIRPDCTGIRPGRGQRMRPSFKRPAAGKTSRPWRGWKGNARSRKTNSCGRRRKPAKPKHSLANPRAAPERASPCPSSDMLIP